MTMRAKPEPGYSCKEDACAMCQCHNCTQLTVCRMHRNIVLNRRVSTTPYPCLGCGTSGIYRPFVRRTSIAICQLYAPPGDRKI